MLPNPYLLVRPLVAREAVLSSRIEGTQADLINLYTYEALQLVLLGMPVHADAQEVFQYVQAMEYGLQRLNELPMSLRLIREVHRVLMQGVRGEYAMPASSERRRTGLGRRAAP